MDEAFNILKKSLKLFGLIHRIKSTNSMSVLHMELVQETNFEITLQKQDHLFSIISIIYF